MIMIEQQQKSQTVNGLGQAQGQTFPNNYASSYLTTPFTPVNNSIINNGGESVYQPFELIVNSTIQDLVDDDFSLDNNNHHHHQHHPSHHNTNSVAGGFGETSKATNLISQLNKMSIDFAAAAAAAASSHVTF